MIINDKYGTAGTITETLEADNENKNKVAYTSEQKRCPTVIPTSGQQRMQPTIAKTESSYLCNCNTNVSHRNCILIGLRTKGRLTKAILDGSAQIVEHFPTYRKTTTRGRV